MIVAEPWTKLAREQLLWIYERMTLIREFEERLKSLIDSGFIPNFRSAPVWRFASIAALSRYGLVRTSFMGRMARSRPPSKSSKSM